jgi:hypothetical protein
LWKCGSSLTATLAIVEVDWKEGTSSGGGGGGTPSRFWSTQ